MATFNKYQNGVGVLVTTANASTDSFKFALTNTTPNAATHTVLADISQISSGNGYAAGGSAVAVTGGESGGTYTLSQDSTVTITASGGSIGPFRYVVFYDDTVASDPLFSYFDYGSSITLADGETFDIGAASTLFTVI
ncbi:MAG: hypothetical protein GY712_07710 [Oceanicoccus sp.]|uniref:hypothetical protein n=1 Tax=Oceanicoccus sp. TaxID=2691044 RepID=UPI0026025C60|nr:hypothetical protein [Oceanicoccus sp.]MCP3907887.1 hypothetical protein [Oceanicoccus sp.]